MRADPSLDFPLLRNRRENGNSLVYLDNAATTQKPRQVLEAMDAYYKNSVANPHRGAYALSAEATVLYEGARARVAGFIGAGAQEVVFTKNATEALNLAAFGLPCLEPGDEIVVSILEHHSNLLPWQRLALTTGAALRFLYCGQDGVIAGAEIEQKITPRTKIVAVCHMSNVLGTVSPVAQIAQKAHTVGALVVVDAAQSAPHMPLDVKALGADLLAFSGHKLLGPEGIGVLYGREALLEQMQPLLLGGGMVERVEQQSAALAGPPARFEAGTPNVAGAVGLHAALDYIEAVGFEAIKSCEQELGRAMRERLADVKGIELYGSLHSDAPTLAFNIKGVHPHDVATILDAEGVAVRAGHHCAQPLLTHLGLKSCCRASAYFYNTPQDVERLAQALAKVERWLG